MKYETVLKELRSSVEAAGLMKWAREHGVSACYVSNVLHGRNPIGPVIFEALGVERVVTVTYRRKRDA